MGVSGDEIAEAVHEQFEKLPAKRKPQGRGDDVQEWVPLSGIVAQVGNNLKCVALGTGMKCLPQSKVSQANGVVLHDWHAEIVAIRSFNYFMLRECQALAQSQEQRSYYLRRRTQSEMAGSPLQQFTVKEDVTLHMYCSEAPCGDASMEFTIAAQDDQKPWVLPLLDPSPSQTLEENLPLQGPLQGRGYFSQLGLVRRKPSRPDAPPTLSKSCSDKISLKQATSLLSSAVSLLISPENAYLTSITLSESQCSMSGCERAFSPHGRMAPLRGRKWPGGYRFHPFVIRTTSRKFRFSRRSGSAPGKLLVPTNIAAAWTPYNEETLIGGVLQGRKQFDPRGASVLCRKSMWKLAAEVAALVSAVPDVSRALDVESYGLVKGDEVLEDREKVKAEVKREVLRGWKENFGDEKWGLGGEVDSSNQ